MINLHKLCDKSTQAKNVIAKCMPGIAKCHHILQYMRTTPSGTGLSLLSIILQMLRIGEMALCLIPLFWFLQAILIWILDASSYNIMTWYYAYFSILRLASQSVPLNHINLKCHEIYSQPSLIRPLPCTGQKAGWRGCRINEVDDYWYEMTGWRMQLTVQYSV